ncbi:MAG TPA: hypothetical protein VJA66_06630 [Thermoanaerobaculia bacterium]
MKTRTTLVSLAMFFIGLALCLAADLQMGTWKLNEEKSKIPAGAPKNTTVVYEMAGDNVKSTIDGVDAEGKPTHAEWTGKFDGNDHPATGSSTYDAIAFKKVNDRTLSLTVKKAGKATASGRIVVAADGKSRTVTLTGNDPNGKPFTSTAVYDKQ